ncbi:hypothetical protein L873DRAFT_1813024 [Choiromyces venosus 120613-1]|uniref:Uncharacterized protein n=1 Tax=Choiromyces venosus 120613-1 TaxID=1336337 RepID=A0A3N4JDI8_9PEZI|nr:hypothetical protein L873DRAFT_1813024 [Choiromyces venosus 120613-1]
MSLTLSLRLCCYIVILFPLTLLQFLFIHPKLLTLITLSPLYSHTESKDLKFSGGGSFLR